MKLSSTPRLVIFIAVMSAVWVASAFSAETAFYQGKTLTVLINFATGGPTDIEGRLVARFLGRHVPGQPLIVVQNMPGAGGVVGTNYLGEVAKPDGLTMGYFTGQFFNVLTADPTLRVDLAKFAYIASIEGVAVAYMRKDVAPGIQDPKDIIKTKGFKVGGLSLNSAKDVRFRLQLDILGVPHQYVTGYNSNSDARLALERNEIQFFTEGTPGYRSQVQPRMVKEGLVVPVYADELVTADGEFRPSAEVPDIPSFSQLHQQIFGKLGSGPLVGSAQNDQPYTRDAAHRESRSQHAAGSRRGATPGIFADDQGSGVHRRIQKGHPLRSAFPSRRRSRQTHKKAGSGAARSEKYNSEIHREQVKEEDEGPGPTFSSPLRRDHLSDPYNNRSCCLRLDR